MKKDKFFVFHNRRKHFQVLFDDIIYIEAFGRKKILHTEDKSYDMNSSVEGIRSKLNSDFIQPHNSFFINIKYIKDINKNEITLQNEIIIPISRRFRKNLGILYYQKNSNIIIDIPDKVLDIIEYARDESKYYHDLLSDVKVTGMDSIPVSSKLDLLKDEPLLRPMRYLMHENEYNVNSERTSGSTGLCMEVGWDKKDKNRSMLPLVLSRYKYYKIKPTDKLCYFYSSRLNGNEDKIFEINETSLGFSKCYLSEEHLSIIFEMILEFEPEWMILQPSIGYILAKYVFEHDLYIPNSIRYIELTGELFTESERKFMENAFQCTTASQYGTIETNSLAYECPYHNLHIMDQNAYVEITDDNGNNLPYDEEGEITVTSLHNHVTPFIRYKVGDRGVLHKSDCKCNNKADILELTSARSNMLINLKNGELLNVYVLIRIIMNIQNFYDIDIYQYKFIHTEINEIEVHVVIKGSENTFKDAFYNNILNEKLGYINFEIIFEKSIFPDNNGKVNVYEKSFNEQ